MTQRDRLIELLQSAPTDCVGNRGVGTIADHLISNGVIVPPCKVGDAAYVINRANQPQEMIFDSVDLRCTCIRDGDCMCGSLCGDKYHNICQYRFKNDFSDVGNIVFLTREEAERAIKESALDG